MRMGSRWRCRSRSDQDHRDTPAPQAFFFGPVPLLPTAGSQQSPGLQPRPPRAGETPDEACRGPRPLGQAEPQGLGRGG